MSYTILCTLLTKVFCINILLYKCRIIKINCFDFCIFPLPVANIVHSIYNKSN